MDTVKYFEEKKRMLNSLGRTKWGCYGVECSNCPLYFNNSGIEVNCGEFELSYPERAVQTVEKWSQEHPQKTMLQDLLEKHHKVMLRDDGTPKYICPGDLGYCEGRYCNEINKLDCIACWNRPLEE